VTETTSTEARLGDPAPLGLSGLAISLGLLSFHNSDLIKEAGLTGLTAATAVIFGGVVSVLISRYCRRGRAEAVTARPSGVDPYP
jgi:succinate-acetate transporter protein